jgi:hypothetical protein
VRAKPREIVGIEMPAASRRGRPRPLPRTAYGVSIESDQREATERGFTLKWSYDANAEQLQIECTKKPFVVPCGMVSGRIEDAAGKCGILAA